MRIDLVQLLTTLGTILVLWIAWILTADRRSKKDSQDDGGMAELSEEQQPRQGKVGRIAVHLIVILFVGLLSSAILTPTAAWILYTAASVFGLIGIAGFMYLRHRADQPKPEPPKSL